MRVSCIAKLYRGVLCCVALNITGSAISQVTNPYIDAADVAATRAELNSLSPTRPRLLCSPAIFQRINYYLDNDSVARGYYQQLVSLANWMVNQPYPIYDTRNGKVLLQTARQSLERIATLSTLYRLNRNPSYYARARAEILELCSWPNWNPVHFFDVAELTHAVSIGYDMLYPYLAQWERDIMVSSIANKGLAAAMERYRLGQEWWLWSGMNMTVVCNSAMVIGALAVADIHTDYSAQVISAAFRSLRPALDSYGNDGAWVEGADYWEYATTYLSYMLHALKLSLNNWKGVFNYSGVRNACDFRMYVGGIGNDVFNYAWTPEGNYAIPNMMFFGGHMERPQYLYTQKEMIKRRAPRIWDLIWYVPGGTQADLDRQPPCKMFLSQGIGVLQSSWSDANRQKLCMKAGTNDNHDSQLELGAFTYDSMGERFVMDLGAEWANLPNNYAKFGLYYRNNTTGNNTLLFDNRNQDWYAPFAPIVGYNVVSNRPYMVANLDGANSVTVSRWSRGCALIEDRYAIVQDEIQAVGGIPIDWNMHTRAQVAISGNIATLTRNGKAVKAVIVRPAGAVWSAGPCNPPPPQSQNNGVTKLTFRVTANGTFDGRFVVAFIPEKAGAIAPDAVQVLPLVNWNQLASLP